MATNDEDSLGGRMKLFEMAEAGRMLMPLLPVMVRLDGKAFHSFTKGLKRPFDQTILDVMGSTCASLVEKTGAVIGYVQSDEISLVLYSDTFKSQVYFDGRISKLTSVLASMATAHFTKEWARVHPEWKKDALFDCRVWNVPSKVEAANALLWREIDATKNSVSMVAQSVFSHKELHKKSSKEMRAMLLTRDVNWNDYSDREKRGSFYRRLVETRAPDAALVAKLTSLGREVPESITRSRVARLDMPPFGRVLNRVGVVFDGAEPVVAQGTT